MPGHCTFNFSRHLPAAINAARLAEDPFSGFNPFIAGRL